MVNAFGWVEYSIIHDIVKRHYQIQVGTRVRLIANMEKTERLGMHFP